MAETDNPGFRAGPPIEASRYFRNRGIRPSFSWQDVEPDEHAFAFSAAKAMRTDIITTLRDELQSALDNGTTFEAFQRTITPRLRQLGWWGESDILDDAGRVVGQGMRGSPRRLRTIYRANMRSARAAGQWERIERTAGALPYLVYLLGPSLEHRPHHRDKEGLVLPVTDPFWREWMPPNGWGCKCHVRQITRREAERRGISQAPEVPTREVVNDRTGAVRDVPQGIDAGWETNPGLTRSQTSRALLEGRLVAADPDVQRVALADIATSWRMRRMLSGNTTGAVPLSVLDESIASALGVEIPIVNLYAPTAAKIARKHPEITQETIGAVAEVMLNGRIALEEREGGGRAIQAIGETRFGPIRVVIKATRDGREAILTTVHRARPDQWEGIVRRENLTIIRDGAE